MNQTIDGGIGGAGDAAAEQPSRPRVPVGPPPVPPPGPIAQSVAVGFRAVYVAAALLAVFWLTNNVREIASDSQAVVRRFGRIVRAQEAGLLVAWPRPIEQVQLLPGPDVQLSRDVSVLAAPSEKYQALVASAGQTAGASGAVPQNIAAYLTGDGNVVLLSASLIYHISDPIAYALAQSHVSPALDRLFRATTVRVTAGRNLNDFLSVQTSDDNGGQAVVALRSEVRESMLNAMNDRLKALESAGASLGVQVERIDMTAWLPPEAKSAFDEVLVATQAADRGVANARRDAERRRQEAVQESERLVSAAQATAKETVSKAFVETAPIVALEHDNQSGESRDSLLLREYRSRVAEIMDRTGRVTLIDPESGVRFVLPGKQ